jgi:hypothetical protein
MTWRSHGSKPSSFVHGQKSIPVWESVPRRHSVRRQARGLDGPWRDHRIVRVAGQRGQRHRRDVYGLRNAVHLKAVTCTAVVAPAWTCHAAIKWTGASVLNR